MGENDFKEGEKVAWSYMGKDVPGVVKEKSTGEVHAHPGGKDIKRKGEEGNPAYVLAMDKGDSKDGKEVAKKGLNLKSREDDSDKSADTKDEDKSGGAEKKDKGGKKQKGAQQKKGGRAAKAKGAAKKTEGQGDKDDSGDEDFNPDAEEGNNDQDTKAENELGQPEGDLEDAAAKGDGAPEVVGDDDEIEYEEGAKGEKREEPAGGKATKKGAKKSKTSGPASRTRSAA